MKQMAAYTLDKIVDDVRVTLDQNKKSNILSNIGDIDTLTLDEIIRSKIVEGVKRVHIEAPVHLLDCGHNFGETIHWKEDCSGWALLPLDFMRLIVFEMDDWSHPVYKATSTESTEYLRQSSRFKGVRGTPQLPKCFFGLRPEGKVLEFYSCKTNTAKVTKAVYLPYPKVSDLGTIDIVERCYNAVLYTIASLVSLTYGENERSSYFNDLAKTSML